MARPLRIEYPGAVYHVMARGNGRDAIVADDEDRQVFVDNLGRVCSRFGWRVWAWCLMDNHYHLLVETPKPNLSRGMREVNGVYTQAYNRRHGLVGHVLQGRYKALLVDKQRYLLELSRYVVLNPVRAGQVAQAPDYAWSSAAAVMGSAPCPDWLVVADQLALFHAQAGPARRAYRRYLADGLGLPDPTASARHQLYLGDDDFVEKAAAKAGRLTREHPRRQRAVKSLAGYAKAYADRDEAMAAAYASTAYTLAEIGAYFGLHYATVSRIVRQRLR